MSVIPETNKCIFPFVLLPFYKCLPIVSFSRCSYSPIVVRYFSQFWECNNEQKAMLSWNLYSGEGDKQKIK
jgi:hypothetical protein